MENTTNIKIDEKSISMAAIAIAIDEMRKTNLNFASLVLLNYRKNSHP